MRDPTYNPKKKKHRCHVCGKATSGRYAEYTAESEFEAELGIAEPTGKYFCSMKCVKANAPPDALTSP